MDKLSNGEIEKQIEDDEHEDSLWQDEDELMDEFCPNCGKEYDAIDYEYQICHYCKHNNSLPTNQQGV